MERWERQAQKHGSGLPDDLPHVLAVDGPHGPVVHATNRAARLAGVTTGARVTDMRALCPVLAVDAADPDGDRAALRQLAFWARRWCPWTVVDGPDGLILDTTGSDHLWGGEAAMLIDIQTQLARIGLTSRPAVAPTWGAASALARFGPVRAVSHDPADLAPLPVAALRLQPDVVLLLQRLGLKTIGALAEVPRLSLARRFARAELAANPLMRLDQATGQTPEPVMPPEAPPVFRADARLAEPIFDPTHHLPDLCRRLADQLEAEGQGARRLLLSVYRTDGEVRHVEASLAAPNRDPQHLARLFRERVEKIDPGFGFDLISLTAPVAEPIAKVQTTLEGKPDPALGLAALVDRLTARFGAVHLSRPVRRESHLPERAEVRAAPLAKVKPSLRPINEQPERPLRLFEPPEEVRVIYAVPEGPPVQFVWRRRTHRITRYQGPERIAPEWWHDRTGTRLRDYFKIEDESGQRYWLYREGVLDDGRGEMPHWFVHGAFA